MEQIIEEIIAKHIGRLMENLEVFNVADNMKKLVKNEFWACSDELKSKIK